MTHRHAYLISGDTARCDCGVTKRPNQRSNGELLLEEQLRQAGIPFLREYHFAANLTPPRKWRADFAAGDIGEWERPVLIEVEGGTWMPKARHTSGSGFEADLTKYNAAAELGYTVLRFSTRMVNDGSALAQIQRVLASKEESNAA
jgi:very-short-patch-repair endonuclease